MALTIVVFLGFNANMRAIPAIDTYAARELPFSIIKNRTLSVDPILPLITKGSAEYEYVAVSGRDGHRYSQFPVTVPLVVAPLYVLPALWLDHVKADPLLQEGIARLMEKLAASLMAAFSVGFVYLALRRRCGPELAVPLALAYAFGTTTWTISAQALWQHGLAQLMVAASVLLITGTASTRRAVFLGLCLGLAAAARPGDTPLLIPLGFYALWWAGSARFWFIIAGLVPTLMTIGYNLLDIGMLTGGYAKSIEPQNFSTSTLEGVAALLVSPTRGLLIFSPFLVFIPLGIREILRDRQFNKISVVFIAAAALQLLMYGMVDWRQGVSWGPRWQTDMLPLLIFLLPPVIHSLSRFGRLAFVLACIMAAFFQSVGAFRFDGSSYARLFGQSMDITTRNQPFWQLESFPVLWDLTNKAPAADIYMRVQGSIDVSVVSWAADGPVIEVIGWTLANGSSPSQILVLANSKMAGHTEEFFERTDVVKAIGDDSDAGWSVVFPARDLQPGPITITVLTRASANGEVWILGEKAIDMDQKTLIESAAKDATAMLIANQQPAGYWLTQFTGSTHFNDPHDELNTYVNAMILDMAGPLAADQALARALAKSRAFLSGQIGADGLVRYHGRPDGPWIGTLGCVITPDSDDTALVWRLAPPIDRKPNAPLAALANYRRGDGLYRTWLAPISEYQCIDPGFDPNPADLTIQMHIYLWLKTVNSTEADKLCQAMRKAEDANGLWSYYEETPLVPRLRQADLAAAGCKLDLPAARLKTQVHGQELWLRMAELLQDFRDGSANESSRQEAAIVLASAATDRFRSLNTTPPLIYQNDKTGHVSRYYWSRDIGLIVWLRLHAALKSAAL